MPRNYKKWLCDVRYGFFVIRIFRFDVYQTYHCRLSDHLVICLYFPVLRWFCHSRRHSRLILYRWGSNYILSCTIWQWRPFGYCGYDCVRSTFPTANNQGTSLMDWSGGYASHNGQIATIIGESPVPTKGEIPPPAAYGSVCCGFRRQQNGRQRLATWCDRMLNDPDTPEE